MNDNFECIVCLDQVPELYTICQCSHKYCLSCCQGQILSKISSFIQIKCLHQGCTSQFNQNNYPFQTLDIVTKASYKKYKKFKYFQDNPSIKNCRQENCVGEFSINKSGNTHCNICQTQHCSKCLEIKHDGQCDKVHDENMKKLGYSQCSLCHIYVQKIQGCDYISCTCGNVFCYKCGVDWVNDPCRLTYFQDRNTLIKQAIQNFRYKKQITLSTIPRILLVGIFQLFSIPFIIIFGTLFLPITVILLILGLILVVSPLLIVLSIFMMGGCVMWLKITLTILIILLYPLVSIVIFLVVVIFLFMYPFIRNNFMFHHGMYDSLEQMTMDYILFGLKILCWIVDL